MKLFAFFSMSLVVASLWLARPDVAMAQAMKVEYEPLTPVVMIPDEEFEANTQVVEEMPFDDAFLSFQMRLPKDWVQSTDLPRTRVNSGLSNKVLGVVSKYISPPKDHLRSFFTFEALELDHEIGARNWFINYILKNGLNLSQLGVESKKQVEAIYVELEGDTTYVVRLRSIINGSRMVIVRYYVPQQHYKDERAQQAQVLKSFELTNREEVAIEKLDIYGFLNQSFFDYPVSWKLDAPVVGSIDEMRATLSRSTVKDKLDGQINIYVFNKMADTSRAKAVREFRDKLEIKNYALGKKIGQPKMVYHEEMSFGLTESYNLVPQVTNMIDYELWVTVLEGEEYIYVVSLLSPARAAEFYMWARNVEAYKIVTRSVRRTDDDVDYYRFIQ